MKIEINENFYKLSENYLFSEVALRVEKKRGEQGKKKIISLGIGDLTRPLAPCVAREISRAAIGLGTKEGFFGYGNTRGVPELRKAIVEYYKRRNVLLADDEIFISDGAKSDLANLPDLFGDVEVLICDPVYPVYLDSSILSGKRVHLIGASRENNFLPSPSGLEKKPFLIYLCSPNNPTGAVFSQAQLKEWVDFALESGSLIIFDAAYEAYVSDKALPRSVFEIEGARECAIEVCSFSKMAGFTGVRCGWTVIPSTSPFNKLWARRQGTKFNGASFISQAGGVAALSPEGLQESAQNVAYYMENARILADFLKKNGIFFCGGVHAPYLWLECPYKMDSWTFFDYLLDSAQVVGTPGVGFGRQGEGYFRLSSFAERENVLEAIARLDEIL